MTLLFHRIRAYQPVLPTPGSSSPSFLRKKQPYYTPKQGALWRNQGLGEAQRQGACLTFMLSTLMRRWTWNSAPTWMTLGTQYSSMLLNCAGGEDGWLVPSTCVLRAGGFPGIKGPSPPWCRAGPWEESSLKSDCFCPSPLPPYKRQSALGTRYFPRDSVPRGSAGSQPHPIQGALHRAGQTPQL